MQTPFAIAPPPVGVAALLGEIAPRLFDERLHACCELVERYATDLSLEIAADLGLGRSLARGATAAEMIAELDLAEGFQPALESLLARLVQTGEIESEGQPQRYRAERPLRASDRTALRTLGLTLDPRITATLDLLDAAAAAHAAVARGAATGEQLLLTSARVQLWLDYFSNDNRVYAISNELAAVAAANRLRSGRGLRILEIGAGAGGAATALLAELERRDRLADLELYELTEPSLFFRRRAERTLTARHRAVPLRCRSLDIDRPASEQGDFGAYDLVYGVNVVHVAHRLGSALARLRALLVPGGWLVAGECCRLLPDQAVPADLVFQLFRGFTQVELDEHRPHHGFLAPDAWRRAFAAAGFDPVAVVPDVERIRALYPRFFVAAVCGRRACVESTEEDSS